MTAGRSGALPADGPVRVDIREEGALWRVLLATPKTNILDLEKITLLRDVFDRARTDHGLKAIVLEGQGDHFCFGADVAEHLPGRFETMIPAFGAMFRSMLDASVVLLAAVRGQCLGGGLELASLCHRVFASPEAKLGQPEILLGVFPPVASVALAGRVGRSRAEDLCLSGRILHTDEAERIGLVDEIATDPHDAAMSYARRYLLPRSASSLRLGVRALHHGFARRFLDELEAVERIYLEELMTTHDAVEGLEAFLQKRKPAWSNS